MFSSAAQGALGEAGGGADAPHLQGPRLHLRAHEAARLTASTASAAGAGRGRCLRVLLVFLLGLLLGVGMFSAGAQL